MHGIGHWAQFAGMSLVSGIWQGFVLAATLWLVLRLVPRATATLRFALWTGVLLVIALLPFLENLPRTHSAQASGHPLLQLDPRWSLGLAALWVALTLYRAGALAVHAVYLWSLRRRSTPVEPDPACAAILADSDRTITLCTSSEVERPSVIGFLAPQILIPAWLMEASSQQQLTPSELHQIVLHEMEHLRRRDDWLNLFQKLALVLFPLNPILLWVERRLCFERELACDDGVLRRTHAPRAYATCLTALAERHLDHFDRRALSLSLGALGAFTAAARQSELTGRVHRILRHEAGLTRLQSRTLTASVGLTLIAGAAGLANCPQFISFTAASQPAAQTATQPTPPAHQGLTGRPYPIAYIEQAAFSSTHPAHLTLLGASPSTPRSEAVKTPARIPARHIVHQPKHTTTPTVERIASVKRPGTREQQWLMLTSWSTDHWPHSHLLALPVDTTVEVHSVLLPYEAVPTANGWFIVQL